ncbi:MAG: FliH/SctL family protein [Kiloniellales bacterium]|nr:FliH/SctL family protein [Kiloniellales bacterium]
MSAGLSQKPFLFDTSFDAAGGKLVMEPPGGEPPAPQFGEEDLERARDEGVAAGREAALRDARLQAEEALVRSEQRVGDSLEALLREWTATERRLAEEATEATGLMLRKLFPVLAESAGLGEVEALIGDCLTRVRDEPRIVVRVAPAQIEAITARIDAVTAQRAYEGKVVVIADDKLAASDALVEWADGGAQRDSERLLTEMDAAIARSKVLLGRAGPTAPQEADSVNPTTPVTEGSSHG